MSLIKPGICLVAFLLSACAEETPDNTAYGSRHAVSYEGLLVPVPTEFKKELVEGTIVLTEAANIRTPREIRFTIVSGEQSPFEDARHRDGLAYQISEVGSGSGGVVWHLSTMKTLGDTSVLVIAHEQSEALSPDFSWVWPIVDGIALDVEPPAE